MSIKQVLIVGVTALALASCGSSNDNDMPDTTTGATITSGSGHVTLGVNSYLWHASLDTLAFMPLQSADPFGGVIITDWYSAPENPNERMKVTIYILDRRLRADGLKIAVFRQTRSARWLGGCAGQSRHGDQARGRDPDARPRASTCERSPLAS